MKISHSRNVREGHYSGFHRTCVKGYKIERRHFRTSNERERLRKYAPHVPHVVDKSQWDIGPWNDEPDSAYWRYNGFSCVILRSRYSGELCGYVGVPFGHPLFGAGPWGSGLQAHGGVNWAQYGHRKAGMDSRLWYFGFDCAHLYDLRPKDKGTEYEEFVATYRTIRYVVTECNGLAAQLKMIEKQAKENNEQVNT